MRTARRTARTSVDLGRAHDAHAVAYRSECFVDATARCATGEIAMVQRMSPNDVRGLVGTGKNGVRQRPEAADGAEEHEARPPHAPATRSKCSYDRPGL